MLAAIAKVAPEITTGWPVYRDIDGTLAGAERRRGNVSEVWAWLGRYDMAQDAAARLFGDVQVALVPKLVEQTASELNATFRTMSYYARLSPSQREALAQECEAIYARLGRPVRASVVTALAQPAAPERRTQDPNPRGVSPPRSPTAHIRLSQCPSRSRHKTLSPRARGVTPPGSPPPPHSLHTRE